MQKQTMHSMKQQEARLQHEEQLRMKEEARFEKEKQQAAAQAALEGQGRSGLASRSKKGLARHTSVKTTDLDAEEQDQYVQTPEPVGSKAEAEQKAKQASMRKKRSHRHSLQVLNSLAKVIIRSHTVAYFVPYLTLSFSLGSRYGACSFAYVWPDADIRRSGASCTGN
jgi:hypothetical protein